VLLISYELGGRVVPGVVTADGRAVPVAALVDNGPRDMPDLIENWAMHEPALRAAVDRIGPDAGEPTSALDTDRRWCPPVPRPSKIMGVAINNGGLSGMASVMPDHPMIFCYPPSALTGHLRPIEIRDDYGLTHPEPELGVVIGRRVKNLSVDQALDAVFGYTVVDDITSVTLKSGDTTVFPSSFAETIGGTPPAPGVPPPGFEFGDLTLTYHARSKGTDTFAPCGPWIVTRDEVPDPQCLAVTLTFDGEECTEDNTSRLVHTVAVTVAHASRYFTLEPGDIIHVGTAAKGRYRLRDIDYSKRTGTRTISIEGVGSLTNPVVHIGGAA
jgi:2-keto-4-pentenoate hydratase/2-oxohepta-3-ene-1,7-dioic acid hydratase in catechol pathway